MEIISRKEAQDKGFKFYFTGVPCHKGHVDFRYTSDCICRECKKIKNSSSSSKKYQKEYRKENRSKHVEYSREYYRENKESLLQQQKEYYSKNKDAYYARAAERRALKVSRSYNCFSEEVLRIYKECRQINSKLSMCVSSDITTDMQYHVDHIIPLKSDFICGLHIPTNLDIIEGRENVSKQNKFTPYAINHLTGEVTHYG